MKPHFWSAFIGFTLVAVLPTSTPAQTPVSYYNQIRPILKNRCQGCHQPATQGGKLVVTNYAAFKAGGASGVSFVPGRPQESILLKFITGNPPPMPKNQKP